MNSSESSARGLLQLAYERAIYEVYLDRETVRFQIGDCIQPLDLLLGQQDCNTWSLITAYNPCSQCLSATVNQQRHQQLAERVKNLRLAHLDAAGTDPDGIWQPELSLLVLGIERETAIALGRTFQQNAIVCGAIRQPAELVWLDSKSTQQ